MLNLKMPTIQCLKKSSCQMYEKFSSKKFLQFVKAVKPVLRLMKRKQRTNTVTPSTCNYDVVESFQNDANESELFRLDFKFFDESATDEAEENLKNEELERLMLRKVAQDEARRDLKLLWAPQSDVDISERGDEFLTGGQRAERQAPVPAV